MVAAPTRDAVAGLEVEPRQQHRIGHGAKDAVACGEQRRASGSAGSSATAP